MKIKGRIIKRMCSRHVNETYVTSVDPYKNRLVNDEIGVAVGNSVVNPVANFMYFATSRDVK